jgi:hypothetical protein
MNKCQAIQVHDKTDILADTITKEAEAGRSRLQDHPGYNQESVSKEFLNHEPEAHTVVLAKWEMRLGRYCFEGSPRQRVHRTSTSKITTAKWTRGVAQVV